MKKIWVGIIMAAPLCLGIIGACLYGLYWLACNQPLALLLTLVVIAGMVGLGILSDAERVDAPAPPKPQEDRNSFWGQR
jgi:ABC-type transport system involved in cytochrome c biogenesis permease subunit